MYSHFALKMISKYVPTLAISECLSHMRGCDPKETMFFAFSRYFVMTMTKVINTILFYSDMDGLHNTI